MAAGSGITFFFQWEVNLIEWLQTHIGSAGISVISLFSMFGEELMLILILGFVATRCCSYQQSRYHHGHCKHVFSHTFFNYWFNF